MVSQLQTTVNWTSSGVQSQLPGAKSLGDFQTGGYSFGKHNLGAPTYKIEDGQVYPIEIALSAASGAKKFSGFKIGRSSLVVFKTKFLFPYHILNRK